MSDGASLSALIAANERFYRALEALDYPAMAALWEQSERVFCVHPGWEPLRGPGPVLESWQRIMENTGEIRFTLTGVDARVEGRLGIVTLYEHIFNRIGFERQASGAVTTNLFAYDEAAGQWRLFHHHASHAQVPEQDIEGNLLV